MPARILEALQMQGAGTDQEAQETRLCLALQRLTKLHKLAHAFQ